MNLDVYLVAAVYRAQVRDPEERIVFEASAGEIDGDESVLAAVAKHFDGAKEPSLGKALVESARMELAANGCAPRAAAPGWRVVDVIAEQLARLSNPAVQSEMRLSFTLDDEQRAEVAAAAAVAVARAFSVYERNPR